MFFAFEIDSELLMDWIQKLLKGMAESSFGWSI
jgi:hypothetical protein